MHRTLRAALVVVALAIAPSLRAEPAWRATLDRIGARRDELARRIDRVVPRLRSACAGRPDLLARIDPAPPAIVQPGWGVVPAIAAEPAAPPPRTKPAEVRYSVAELDAWVGRELERIGSVESALDAGGGDLERAVEDDELARENQRRIDAHVNYHAFWQDELRRHPGFLDVANALLAEWRRLPDDDVAGRGAVAERVIAFTATPGLAFEPGADGARVMRVPIVTDVDDPAFLAAFEDGVETVWNGSSAMRAANARLRVELEVVPVARLYPEGPPSRGELVDLACHRSHFDAPLVLTTGGGATHAFQGAIVVGPSPIARHDLAHELGHLLGFSDGYLRAFEGSPDDASGVVFVELRDLGLDIMSNPGSGIVTPEMVDHLLAAYASD